MPPSSSTKLVPAGKVKASKSPGAKAAAAANASSSKRKAEDDGLETADAFMQSRGKQITKMRMLLQYRASDKCKKARGLHQVNALIQSMLRKRGDSPSPGALASVCTQEADHLLVHSHLYVRRRLTISWCTRSICY